MAGFLIYGKDFRAEHYKGGDGLQHSEIQSVDGDFFTICNSTFDELTELCAAHGVPVEAWPVYESCIDVPIAEVYLPNRLLKQTIPLLPYEVVRSSLWLEKIIGRIKQGDIVVFCRT